MPRINRRSSSLEYSPPDPFSGRLIGVDVADPVELLEIANVPYTESGFSKLAYYVGKSRLRKYVDEFFTSFIENVQVESIDSTGFSTETALRCLVFEAFWSPMNTAQEFKFVTGTDSFLTGIGVFSLNSKFDFGVKTDKSLLGKVAQYSLESLHNLSLGLLIAIVMPDSSWQVALGHIHVHKYTKKNSASVKFALFDPDVFTSAFLSQKDLNEVEHESFQVYIPLTGDMSYFK